jgi:uncharacterized protein YutE (UPF0331/DUF86 family)
MVDRPLIFRKLDSLSLYTRQLAEFRGVGLEEYVRDWKVQRIVERTLQMAVEICADIADHIISDEGLRAPVSVADAFTVLRETSIVSETLHGALVKMAKFRNVVVHQYDEVDAEIVIAILTKHLGTFDTFRTEILSHLKG